MRSPSRRRLARSLLLPVLALAACGREETRATGTPAEDSARAARLSQDSLYGAPAAHNIRVQPVEIEVPGLPRGWDGIRIAAVSDFQLGLWGDNEKVARAALERAVRERPDFVVLLGDYVARGNDYGALDRVLAPLRGYPAFAVLGTADEVETPQGEDSTRLHVMQAMQRNGVRLLRNNRAPFGRNGDTAYVAGIEPFLARRSDVRQAETFAGIPGGPRTPVLLSHMPAIGPHLPDNKYGAVLSGHTFCGQVEVPGTPRLSWLNTEVYAGTQPPTRRIYKVHGSTVFATCGVGYSFVPVRFGYPPEVAMVTLRTAIDTVRKPGGDTTAARQPNLDSLLQVYQRPRDTTQRAPDTAGAEPVPPR